MVCGCRWTGGVLFQVVPFVVPFLCHTVVAIPHGYKGRGRGLTAGSEDAPTCALCCKFKLIWLVRVLRVIRLKNQHNTWARVKITPATVRPTWKNLIRMKRGKRFCGNLISTKIVMVCLWEVATKKFAFCERFALKRATSYDLTQLKRMVDFTGRSANLWHDTNRNLTFPASKDYESKSNLNTYLIHRNLP